MYSVIPFTWHVVTVHSEVGVSVQMFKRLPMSLSPTMSKLDDASTASVAALDAAEDKYDDDDDDDDRKLSPLAPGGMMTERGDDNIVPARCANAAFASPPSVEEDEDASPAASASSPSLQASGHVIKMCTRRVLQNNISCGNSPLLQDDKCIIDT